MPRLILLLLVLKNPGTQGFFVQQQQQPLCVHFSTFTWKRSATSSAHLLDDDDSSQPTATCTGVNHQERHDKSDDTTMNMMTTSRRSFVTTVAAVSSSSLWFLLSWPHPAVAKCKDLDSCREIGEQKEAADLAANPIVRLGGEGLQYKVLTAGVGDATVTADTDTVKIAYSISQASGSYMYSQGFGYNKLDAGNGKQMSDLGLDGLTLHLRDETAKEVPMGIRQAIQGMKRGEKRRIVVPPSLGFDTSDWNPKPTTFRGERQILSYQTVLSGRGGAQPPFPAPTIWDVELLSLR